MMLIGLIWATLAPLSLLLIAWLLAWALRRAQLRHAVPLALSAVALPVAAFWFADRAEFIGVCESEGKPAVLRKARADGIFLNSGTSNSFGMRYLHDEGFAWVEAPSIYKRGEWVRYERSPTAAGPADIKTVEIPAITARYEVREEFSQPFSHTGLSQTLIVDRESGELMARASSATFSGGRMKWVLGAWGMQSCPSAMSEPEDFNDYYHLAQKTLR